MTVEEKKQRCRDILELGMEGLSHPEKKTWFDWAAFQRDLIGALEELEDSARQETRA